MKQKVPVPLLAAIAVVVLAALGFWMYRSMENASGVAASTPHLQPPSPFAKKPDFSKMTPEQIAQMKKGGMGAMMGGGGAK